MFMNIWKWFWWKPTFKLWSKPHPPPMHQWIMTHDRGLVRPEPDENCGVDDDWNHRDSLFADVTAVNELLGHMGARFDQIWLFFMYS